MKKVQVGLWCLASAVMIMVLTMSTVCAQPQCRIIRIYDQATTGTTELVWIEPQTVIADGSTCIIWVNLGKASMKVTFEDGKRCVEASSVASGFSLIDGCYVTGWVPQGGTSSITITEKGTYQYEIEWEAAAAKATGKVIVQ